MGVEVDRRPSITLLTVKEVARLYNLDHTTIYRRIHPGGASRRHTFVCSRAAARHRSSWGADRRVQLIQHATGMGEDWSDHFVTYVYTGVRLQELYRLRPEHVLVDHLFIDGTKTERAERTVPLAPDELAIIERRAQNVGPDGFLFSNYVGWRQRRSTNGQPIARLATRFARRVQASRSRARKRQRFASHVRELVLAERR